LSKESNISLDKIIKQYAKCRNILLEDSNSAAEAKGSKREGATASPQVAKRRKVTRGEAITQGKPFEKKLIIIPIFLPKIGMSILPKN